MKKPTDFSIRKEGEIIPEGLSITQTEDAWYIRVKDRVYGVRKVRLPKQGSYLISEDLISSELIEKPIDEEKEKAYLDFLENNNDY